MQSALIRTVASFAAALFLAALTGCNSAKDRHVPQQLETTTPSTASSVLSAPPGKYGDFQQVFADVAESGLPAVVSIHSEKAVVETGLGSGVLIDSNGTILTNNHVIEGADRIQVQLHDDREFEAEVLGADPPSDLAVIRLKNAVGAFPSLPLGNSDNVRIGEWVLAVGSPYGLSQTVTTGIISAKGRHNTGISSYENFLQTDAAINPGNSGGALINLRGELVGINSAIFSQSGGYQGIGFAIPINMAKKISADLIRDGKVTRGWLGVSIQSLNLEQAVAAGLKDRHGAFVGGVLPGGPAEKAGLRRNDVILAVGSKPIDDPNDLLNYIALQLPGSSVDVKLNRAGKVLVLKAHIDRRVN